MATTIWLGGLRPEVTHSDLEHFLKKTLKLDHLQHVDLARKRPRDSSSRFKPQCFAFLKFEKQASAVTQALRLHGHARVFV